MVRLDRTIQKQLKLLKRGFIDARKGVLYPPVKPEDDEGTKPFTEWIFKFILSETAQ
jgi:hypothetical protein